MDTVLVSIFSDQSAEFINMANPQPSEDMMDLPLTGTQVDQVKQSSQYYVTSGDNAEGGTSEIEFNLAQNFWGCYFDLGSNSTQQSGLPSNCGQQIRKGIAHLIDKTVFSAREPAVSGYSVPIDNPLPGDNSGLPAPNPCSWDSSFVQNDSGCKVGASGGEAYHLASATGVNYAWQSSLGSADFCAAAQHFVNAGLATGKDHKCVLTGISSSVSVHPVKFWIADDNFALLDLGDSMAQEICALFGNGFADPCPQLSVNKQPANALLATRTFPTVLNLDWGMFTSGPSGFAGLDVFQEVASHLTSLGCLPSPPSCKDPFDSALYFAFNSRFTSVPPSYREPNGPCSSSSPPSYAAPNYMYLCSPGYDNISALMEYAPCVSASGDPSSGQITPTFANCSGQSVTGACSPSSACTGVSAGYQTEDMFGRNVFTLPVFDSKGQQYVYLHYTPGNPGAIWQRVITHMVSGPTNYFTWLNAYNSAPAQPSTIRQMMAGSTSSLNPYIASTPYDMGILSAIYDSLGATNPLADTQYIDWMSISSLPQTTLTYSPPTGTVLSYRFTLRPNLNFQDGTPVTAFDVAFSYLSLLANGAFQSAGAAAMTGITILSPTQFDINISGDNGLFTKIALASLTILPGRYWTKDGVPDIASKGSSTWDSKVATCTANGNSCYPTQYVLQPPPSTLPPGSPLQPKCTMTSTCMVNAFNETDMTADPNKVDAFYDPIHNQILIGSGAWTCGTGTIASGLGRACAPGNIQNPGVGQSYTLQRNGKGTAPGFLGDYFRSSGSLATWLWSGDINPGPYNFSIAKACFGAAPVPLGPTPDASSCAHWQQGIGTNGATTPPGTGGCPAGSSPCGIAVGSTQLSIVKLFINIDWVYPYVWNSANPPNGIVGLDPILYAGSGGTLYPAAGNGSVGCASPYPTGGYDC